MDLIIIIIIIIMIINNNIFNQDKPVRDGPLEKLWGGRGIFDLQEFFFVTKFLV